MANWPLLTGAIIAQHLSPEILPMNTRTNALALISVGAHARQGDTLLRRIAVQTIPVTAKQIKSPTLALGEVSGHHHTFRDGGAIAFADDEEAVTATHVSVTADRSVLTHEEHEAITFPKGDYESLKQVEDTGAEVRQVLD